MKRRWLIFGLVGVGAVGVGMVVATRQPTNAASGTPTSTAPPETAKVKRTDLVDEQKLNGALGYGDATTAGGLGSGTITALPELGTVLKQGDSMWQIDGHVGPALFYGDLPLWRTMRSGITDGADVTQLEQNLTDLGFGADLTVDAKFDSHTAAAIKAWQDSRGLKKTGSVSPADVVIEPAAVRVAERHARVGAQVGPDILGVTSAEQIVTMDVSLTNVALLKLGAAVQIQLPDETKVAGTVSSIGRVATSKQGATATIAASVTPAAPVASLDAAPVNVLVSTPKATGVLVVPIRALVALAEGGYAVEKVSGSTTQLVAVKPGEFGDGIVAISGGAIAEGDTVVVAP